jgi:hypothetical protein
MRAIMDSAQNKYCERLGIPVPCLDDVVAQGTAKLFHLMVAALLERGSAMTLDEIAERLEYAGVPAKTGDIAYSLQKAWHGMQPVYRDATGRFGLNLDALELRHLLWTLGLNRSTEPPPAAPPLPPPSDDVPLSAEEIDAAFRDRSITNLSWTRQAAAVLDALQTPMTAEEIEAFLAGLTTTRTKLRPHDLPSKSELFLTDEAMRLTQNPTAPGLFAMRRAIRKLSHPVLTQRAQRAVWEERYAIRRAELDAEARREAEIACRLRRAVVRVLPSAEEPEAAALLDVGQRSIRTFFDRELTTLKGELERFDVIAGLHIRDTLLALGVDADRFRLVDLKPPRKSMRLNRVGRTLQITPEILISGTTGISRPFGEPEKVARDLFERNHPKLARRLVSDVKALYAFYQYGVLHGAVRLHWGFVDESLATDWALPGEAGLYSQLKSAIESGAAVDLVVGSAPSWTDPWSRTRRVRVVEVGPFDVLVTEGEGRTRLSIARSDIQAVCLVPDHEG